MSIKLRWLSSFSDSDEAKHLRFGKWGEKQAERHLKAKGYRILGRRVRVGTKDEFDLLARHGAILVFVEVKSRTSEAFGRPIDSVDRDKQYHLSRAAVRYLERLRKRPEYFRFDVVEVVGSMDSGDPDIRHIENAFALDSRFRLPW